MNGVHSPFSGTATFLCRFDQKKYSGQNIDQNKHNEELGVTDDDYYDDDVVVSSSSE